MIDFKTTKVGDKLRIVGAGAPGYAKLGDVVTVAKCNGHNRVDVVDERGEPAYFALTCGAARLEPVLSGSSEPHNAESTHMSSARKEQP